MRQSHCDGGYTTGYLCQNSQNRGKFYYILYLNKFDLKKLESQPMRSNIQLIRILEKGNEEKTMGEKINNEILKTISHNRGQEFA